MFIVLLSERLAFRLRVFERQDPILIGAFDSDPCLYRKIHPLAILR